MKRARLEKELEKFDKEVERVQKKLSNQGFVAKAPAAVIEGACERARLPRKTRSSSSTSSRS